MSVTMVKRCRGCGDEKPLDEFNRDRRSTDGRRTRCRACELRAPWRLTPVSVVRIPEKQRAMRAVYRALKKGTLVKPSWCANCGAEGDVQAHHYDYRERLTVIWLCVPCHKHLHALEWEVGRLREQLLSIERERDSLVKQSLAQGAWMEGAMPNFSEVAAADARAEVAEQRVKELESALRELDVRSMSDYDAALTRAALAQSDPPAYLRVARAALAQPEDLG